MGGDNAPLCVVEGIDIFCKKHNNVEFSLYGDERTLTSMLLRYPHARKFCKICPTQSVISGEEKPSKALRMAAGSSMGEAIMAVKRGEVDGIVSAGNTGALMAISKIYLRMLAGVSRPAICTLMPTVNEGKPMTMLDLGANALVDASNLFEFAVMGSIYFSTITGIEKPKLGLLNIGSEESKGLEYIKDAADMIRAHDNLNFNFAGYAEGNDILSGNFDVIVSDGFSGNIALKSIEGTAKAMGKMIKQAFSKNIFTKLSMLVSALALKKFKERMNPSNYNGAMMIGLNGVVIKSHGGADSHSFSKAVEYAAKLVASDLNSKIRTQIEQFPELKAEIKAE